jgi:antitoxin HicB
MNDKHYTVSDGKLMLYLRPAEEGGYNVTSPLDPGLITQAETLEEAFEMAYDAQQALNEAREKLSRGRRIPSEPSPTSPRVVTPADLAEPDAAQSQRASTDTSSDRL